MAELKPKRGQTHVEAFGRTSGTVPLLIGDMASQPWLVPVLVIPEPDRDPTPEELDALSEALYATTAPGALNGPFAAMLREVARTAWKLGARVPHA